MKKRTLGELKAKYGIGDYTFRVVGNCGEKIILCACGINVVDEITAVEAYEKYFKKNEGIENPRADYIIIEIGWWGTHRYERGWIDETRFRWIGDKTPLGVEETRSNHR